MNRCSFEEARIRLLQLRYPLRHSCNRLFNNQSTTGPSTMESNLKLAIAYFSTAKSNHWLSWRRTLWNILAERLPITRSSRRRPESGDPQICVADDIEKQSLPWIRLEWRGFDGSAGTQVVELLLCDDGGCWEEGMDMAECARRFVGVGVRVTALQCRRVVVGRFPVRSAGDQDR